VSDSTEATIVKLPEWSVPASVYLGDNVYAEFTGQSIKLYVSDGRFASPPLLMSFEDIGQLLNYAAQCYVPVKGANDD
jgi:hypothetical protein